MAPASRASWPIPRASGRSARTELVDAALRLFAERGFRGTTIADFAAATGTAHGLVWHYFRSNDDLFEAILGGYSFLPASSRFLPVRT